jgi:hypothetical protein
MSLGKKGVCMARIKARQQSPICFRTHRLTIETYSDDPRRPAATDFQQLQAIPHKTGWRIWLAELNPATKSWDVTKAVIGGTGAAPRYGQRGILFSLADAVRFLDAWESTRLSSKSDGPGQDAFLYRQIDTNGTHYQSLKRAGRPSQMPRPSGLTVRDIEAEGLY